MAVNLHFGKDLDHDSLPVDHKRRSLDAHVFLAVHALLFPHPVGFSNLFFVVGQQGERQVEFLGELGVRAAVIGADAQNDGPAFV